ncbi:nucleotide-binding protein [Fervidobacterium sp. 2310opik-2]|uniref:nucleotide-binding protein n=1 Tax=Fervidobacterium sp. 2310opik-2 TaxID=1755815 RepID=UPI0013DF93B7|nr:nucleotide-binding protein [Fervidobacterium sp. 2310opik-2]KAF2962248.1 nucleotide-binding protein [Fervidobacterium sp. 2310opik-2]
MKKLLVISFFVLLVVSAFSEVIPIAQIYKLKEGETVEATGVVLVEPSALMNKTTWIQDSTAGIMVYGNLPTLKLGDVIKITGKTKLYYGILEILPDKIEVIGKSEVKPVNLNELFNKLAEQNGGKVSQQKIGEAFNSVMSMLVTLEGTISSIQGYQFTVKTEYFEILIYLRKEANVSTKDLKVGDKVSVTGIMYLYKDTFEILPRNQQDVVKK